MSGELKTAQVRREKETTENFHFEGLDVLDLIWDFKYLARTFSFAILVKIVNTGCFTPSHYYIKRLCCKIFIIEFCSFAL